MGPHICGDSGIVDFRDACVRVSWSVFVPAILVLTLCIFSLPAPPSVRRVLAPIQAPFKNFLTVEEAEALDATARAGDTVDGDEEEHTAAARIPVWRTVVFVAVGLLQTLAWLGIGSYRFIDNSGYVWGGLAPILLALVWLYTAVRPVAHPTGTPPYDVFTIYVVNFVGAVLQLGGFVYESSVYGRPLPAAPVLVAHVANLVAVVAVIVVVLNMPMALPSARVNKADIGSRVSPEEYSTLWNWLSFAWIAPLIKKGKSTTLSENDVWPLSQVMQSRPVFVKFSQTQRPTLLWRLLAANSHDMIMDILLTILGVAFNFAGPFFLKRILDAIDSKNPNAESRAQAYIYAVLMFIFTMLKAQTDAQHLYLGRRAVTRVRSELTAAIYDKALKRKDFSGLVDAAKAAEAVDKKGVPATAADKSAAKAKAAKSDDPKAGASVGKIVQLMSGDVNWLVQGMGAWYWVYGAPFEIIFAFTFLYQLLGFSAFAGFFVIIAASPLNSVLTKRSLRIKKGVLSARDKRMTVLNELITAVKFIKFFAWEDRWVERALVARQAELKWMAKSRTNDVLFSLVTSATPVLISIVSFSVYVLLGNELTVSTAFTAIALFNMVRQPLVGLPSWIVLLLQTGIVVKRISVFLDEDEVSEQVSSLKRDLNARAAVMDDGLGLENATLKWNELEKPTEKSNGKKPESNASTATLVAPTDAAVGDALSADDAQEHRFELKDISVKFPEGELTVVTGPTASGKTALLLALLGELTLLEGRINLPKNTAKLDENGLMHAISYAAQSPWLQHLSIKDNILFGYPYDEARYKAVVEACALKPDLNILEDGDATEVGARGINLSGGQKARVALARAVYARTKYVLLDDPLSAVDSHTARWLYEKLFQGPLLANRTVVLVTHHIDLVLPGTHYLVRMLDGRIDAQGTVKELRAQGVLDDIAQQEAIVVKEEEPVVEKPADLIDASAEKSVKAPRKLVEDEHREVGGVKWKVYHTYLHASSYFIWGFLAVLVILSQVLGISEKLWIKTWGEAYDQDTLLSSVYRLLSSATFEHEIIIDRPLSPSIYASKSHGAFHTNANWPNAQKHPLYYVGIYAGIGLATALVTNASNIAQYTGALRASRILFKRLLVNVVRATMRWHDVTPQGRMLNRFGKDMDTIDSSLASSLQGVNSSLAAFFASVITVAVVFPWFLVPAVFIGAAYRHLAIGYLNTGRDLRRMESNSRSPIYSDFAELLAGIVTVRAFAAEPRFLDALHARVDYTTKMWHAFWMTNRWLLLNFDFLSGIAVLITTVFALSDFVSAGIAGLCITSAMAFTTSVYWACRYWTMLELDLNSVERVVEYLDLPQEPPAVISDHRPPAYWPSSTNNNALVVVEDLVVKYAPELPPVLHGVSFTLKARERVGILGRTGSGKSTLAMSLLRFVDPARGRILIDGIDISTIGTHDLRSRLTFIPQDAPLFSGTLRENLDPFNEHTDAACLDVLARVHLITEDTPSPVPSLHGAEPSSTPSLLSATDTGAPAALTLDTPVSAGGANVSHGQRQLIALARALLRRAAVVVLDEATSSIDFAADAAVQAALRSEFRDALLLTVAHRLRTVIDYDRLLVLDKGEVVEFDTPLALLAKPDGVFRGMCVQSGALAELEAAARAAAEGE